MSSSAGSRRTWLILGAATVVAVICRAVGLDSGLWYDEIATLVDFARKPLASILGEYNKNNHPLYSVLAHAALTWFGEHAWSLRLPAVVFGVACVPAVYALGTVIGSSREGLLAACLLAVSYHHIWFSQNARGYTALAFWAMLSSILLLRSLRRDHLRWPVLYGVVGALGLYTHLAIAFLLLAHVLAWLWLIVGRAHARTRQNWRPAAIGFAVAGTVALLLYAPMLPQMYDTFRQPSDLRSVATPRWAVREILHGLEAGFGSWGALLGVLLLGVGLWDYRRQKWLVATLLVLPGALTAIGTVVLRLPTQPRYFFFLIGSATLIVVRGAMIAGSWIASAAPPRIARLGTTVPGATLVGALVLANVLSLGQLYRHPKQDYEGAMEYVEARRATGDVVLTAGVAVRPYQEYYGKPWQAVRTPEKVQRVRSRAAGRVWIVYASPEYMPAELLAWIRRECRSATVFPGTLSGGEVVVCTLKSLGCAEREILS